ncbi:MAG: hemerythrin domain-containing protein [Chloroflexi bacterium]|nr:hemerythrin domain-containing protein [Chloroflexota bacterium]
MRISEYLRRDHRAICEDVWRLEQQLEIASLSIVDVKGTVATIRSALENHAKLEEKVLFPALERELGSDDGPLAVMEAEHSQISALFSRIDGARDGGNVPMLTKDLTGLLLSHFAKEERELFPIADELLGAVEIDGSGVVQPA